MSIPYPYTTRNPLTFWVTELPSLPIFMFSQLLPTSAWMTANMQTESQPLDQAAHQAPGDLVHSSKYVVAPLEHIDGSSESI